MARVTGDERGLTRVCSTSNRQQLVRVSSIVLRLVFCGVLVAPVVDAADTYTIRSAYRVGERLHYAWHLESKISWSPEVKDFDWINLTTDFDFVLEAERLTGDGGCVFDVQGRALESVAEGAKGKLGISATPTEASYLLGKSWTKPGAKTPLKGPMSITLGSRFEPVGSNGIEPLAIFFLAGVDGRVWYLVTSAPSAPVSVGSKWSHEFSAAVPGARGNPLHVVVNFEVAGVERIQGSPILTIHYKGELDLEDSDLQMKNGEIIHVVRGQYEAKGVARWDVERGVLYSAEVEQTMDATADKPESRRLTSKAVSRIALAGT